MMKTPLICIVTIFLVTAGAAHAQTILFSDDFDGAGTEALNGKAPDVRPGGEVWDAKESTPLAEADPRADGTFTGGSRRTGNLPVQIEDGNVYTLSATMRITNPDPASQDFGGISFNTDQTVATHLQSDFALLLIRRNGAAEAVSAGGGETIEIPAGTYDLDRAEGHELVIVLDTTQSPWTAEYKVNGHSLGVRKLAARKPGTTFINIGQYDSASAAFDRLELATPGQDYR